MTHLRMLLCVFFLSICGVSFSQSKVGHINAHELISHMPETKAAQQELKKLEVNLKTEIETRIKELQDKHEKYSADAQNQMGEINQQRQEGLRGMQQQLQVFQQKAMLELQNKENELLIPIRQKASEAIQKIAADQGYDYVFDSTPGGVVLYADSEDNLMDLVMKKLTLQDAN